MNKQIKHIAKAFFSLAVISVAILAMTQTVQAATKRCSTLTGLVDCNTVRSDLLRYGYTPSDTKCFKLSPGFVQEVDCAKPPFSIGAVEPEPVETLPPAEVPEAPPATPVVVAIPDPIPVAAPATPVQAPLNGGTVQARENCTSSTDCGNLTVIRYINTGINMLSGLVAVIVVIMIVVGGIQYSAAGGNPQATAAAKHRIINAILAFVAYLFLFIFLSWLVPGGL